MKQAQEQKGVKQMVRARLASKMLLVMLILTLLCMLALGAERVSRAREGAVTSINFRVRDPDSHCPVTCTITNGDPRGLVVPRLEPCAGMRLLSGDFDGDGRAEFATSTLSTPIFLCLTAWR